MPMEDVHLEENRAEKLHKEALSLEHMLTHVPKNPFCEICLRAKMFKQQARRQDPELRENPMALGDMVHADTIVVGRRKFNHEVGGSKCALFVSDRATGVEDAPALRNKSTKLTENALRYFAKG